MCKIIIEEENTDVSEDLKTKLASLFPEHEVIDASEYKSKKYERLETAVDNLINKVGPAVEERLNKSMSV